VPEASRDFRRAIDTDPKRQDARIQLGELYLVSYLSRLRDWQSLPPLIQALSDELLKLDPKSAPGLRLRGCLELTGGRLQEAIATFRQANELTPLKPDIVLPLAQALFAGGQAADAEKLSRALIEKEKTLGSIYDLLYVQAMRANRPADGESVLQLKIASNPTSTDFRLQLARHYYIVQRGTELRAALLVETVNPKEIQIAVNDLQAVISRKPTNAVLRFNLGRAQLALSQVDQAKTQFQEAAKLQKDYIHPRLALAAVGNRDQARADLAETIKAYPNSREAHIQLGLLDLAEKRYKEAEVTFSKLYQETPDDLIWRFCWMPKGSTSRRARSTNRS